MNEGMKSSRSVAPTLLFLSRSVTEPSVIEALHRGLQVTPGIDYRVLREASSIPAAVDGAPVALLIANCLVKEDIAELYNVLPSLAARVSIGTLRVIVFNTIGHPRLSSLLRSRSALEVVEFPTTIKAIQHKLKIALAMAQKSFTAAAESRGLTTAFKAEAKAAPKVIGKEVVWQSATEFFADVWWIPGRKNIRNVVGVWLIDILGPGPVVGTWEEMPNLERAGEKGWVWRPRSIAEDIFQTREGRWIFFGKQPEFSWQKNLWSFISKQPFFAYYPNAATEPEYTRFEFRPTEGLLFLENSRHTESLLGRIQATFESRLGFSLSSNDSAEVDWKDGQGNGERKPTANGEWNEHGSSVGVDFGKKDLRIDTKGKVHPFRNALTPSEVASNALGFKDLAIEGVTSGGETFAKIELNVEILRKNDVVGAGEIKSVKVYDLSEAGATLLFQPGVPRSGDRFLLRIKFDSGETRMECSMEWVLTSIEFSDENQLLAFGDFRAGDFDPLFTILDKLQARKLELKNFYAVARG